MNYKESVIQGKEAHPIQHVVVLMLENRAFDHMLGWMKADNPDINGLTGDEFNYEDPFNTSSRKYYVHDNASYVDPNPGHYITSTTTQIYGSQNVSTPAAMNGFVKQAIQRRIPPEAVMSGFKPADVPVITTLGKLLSIWLVMEELRNLYGYILLSLAAKEFALIDEFHAGLPGPTLPNRLMFHSATTHGDCANVFWEQIKGHPQKPIYMAFEEVGRCPFAMAL